MYFSIPVLRADLIFGRDLSQRQTQRHTTCVQALADAKPQASEVGEFFYANSENLAEKAREKLRVDGYVWIKGLVDAETLHTLQRLADDLPQLNGPIQQVELDSAVLRQKRALDQLARREIDLQGKERDLQQVEQEKKKLQEELFTRKRCWLRVLQRLLSSLPQNHSALSV